MILSRQATDEAPSDPMDSKPTSNDSLLGN